MSHKKIAEWKTIFYSGNFLEKIKLDIQLVALCLPSNAVRKTIVSGPVLYSAILGVQLGKAWTNRPTIYCQVVLIRSHWTMLVTVIIIMFIE